MRVEKEDKGSYYFPCLHSSQKRTSLPLLQKSVIIEHSNMYSVPQVIATWHQYKKVTWYFGLRGSLSRGTHSCSPASRKRITPDISDFAQIYAPDTFFFYVLCPLMTWAILLLLNCHSFVAVYFFFNFRYLYESLFFKKCTQASSYFIAV